MHPGEERGHSEGHCNVITSLGTKLLGNGPWPSLCVVRFQRRYNKLLCDDQEFAIRTGQGRTLADPAKDDRFGYGISAANSTISVTDEID